MVTLQHIQEAKEVLEGVAYKTPLMRSMTLSEKFQANVLLKRSIANAMVETNAVRATDRTPNTPPRMGSNYVF